MIFSAHSLPERVVDIGDTYPEQLLESATLAAEIAGVPSFDVAWQSAGRTADPWLGPDILVALREKRAHGFTDVVSCPIGFVSDHLEVLFDIDIEAQGVARRDRPQPRAHRRRSMTTPVFTSILANVIRQAAA